MCDFIVWLTEKITYRVGLAMQYAYIRGLITGQGGYLSCWPCDVVLRIRSRVGRNRQDGPS